MFCQWTPIWLGCPLLYGLGPPPHTNITQIAYICTQPTVVVGEGAVHGVLWVLLGVGGLRVGVRRGWGVGGGLGGGGG